MTGNRKPESRTADFADDTDKSNASDCDSSVPSALSAVKNSSTDFGRDFSSLPNGWRWVTLREIADISGGITKGQKYRATDVLRRVPYLRVANVQRGYLDLSEIKEIDATEAKISALQLQAGDILFNEGGDRDKLGRGWIWNDELPVCIHQNHVFRARLRNSEHSPRFISYYSNSAGQQYFYDQGKHTTNLASINLTKLGELPIPLPPPAEQHRIVAEIEKQFTRLEAGVAALKRVQANLKRYRAAVLKAACEGRLVPTEAELRRTADNADGADQKVRQSASSAKSAVKTPAYETGAELLARILNERRQNWQGRGQYKEPAAPDTTNLSPLPEGWTWATVEQTATAIVDCPHSTPKWTDRGRMCVRTTEFRAGLLDLAEVRFVSEESFQERIARLEPRAGDILYSREGGILGIACPVPQGVSLCLGQRMMLIRPSGEVVSHFVMGWLNSTTILSLVKSLTSGSASPHLNVGDIRQFPIPLPPLAEQARIVAEVERRLSVVEELEAVVSANLQRATRLRQSILQKAFTGELV